MTGYLVMCGYTSTTPKKRQDMSKELKVRWGWLKGMYIYTMIGAGGLGLGRVVMTDEMRSMFGWITWSQMALAFFSRVISFNSDAVRKSPSVTVFMPPLHAYVQPSAAV